MRTFNTQSFIRYAALLGTLSISGPAFSANVDWEGWKFDYSTNDNASGLVLTDVEFNGKQILNKASMPVMRVKYEDDICGPYADILSQFALTPPVQGAPDSACDNQAVCTRTYTQNGEKMFEVGSNWQIGEYQIYQTYYFSENGYFDARVYSRGLQCLVDHSHHAKWMFDFDIDGAEDDVVERADGSVPATEFNDLRSESDGWTIRDKQTGNFVNVIPADDDGEPIDFSRVDVAVRAWQPDEIGVWRLGARSDIADNFRNNQNVDGADIVFWYVTHLPHSADEGPSVWHASGPRIQVGDITARPVDPDPPVEPPAPEGNNLLANGDFEAGKAAWLDCGPSTATRTVTPGRANGSQALQISDGGCLYQEVPVTVGEEYVLACDANRSGSDWTIMELSYLDENYGALLSRVAQISTEDGTSRPIVGGTAPAGTVRGLALLYSEDDTQFDNCEFIPTTPPTGPDVTDPELEGTNLLSNGGFEMDLRSWTSCAESLLATPSADSAVGSGALALQDGGCLYQEFDASPDSTYAMQCQARKVTGNQYTSVSLSLMDETYTALTRTELPVETTLYANVSASLTAPAASVRGALTLYSESPGVFDDCVVVEQ